MAVDQITKLTEEQIKEHKSILEDKTIDETTRKEKLHIFLSNLGSDVLYTHSNKDLNDQNNKSWF